MKCETLNDLFLAIYEEIKNANEAKDLYSIPDSDTFYKEITEKYNLIPFNIPTIMKILTDSRMIFTIDIVKEDRKNKIRRLEGYIVSKGDIINAIKRVYEDELSRLYAIEFNKKLPGDKAIEVFAPHIDEFNNTPLGKIGTIAYQLMQMGKVLEWDIMKYSQKVQEDRLKSELEQAPDISSFIAEKKTETSTKPGLMPKASPGKNIHKHVSSSEYEKFADYSKLNSPEKTLTVYGIEFYTRVCFREYNYQLMLHHVKSGLIHKKDDLVIVKKLLARERANADNDSKIQEYAAHINTLEKEINNRLKTL